MDRLEKNTGNSEEGFIKTVFPFDEAQKGTLLNILQYSILAIIPIIILLKLIICGSCWTIICNVYYSIFYSPNHSIFTYI